MLISLLKRPPGRWLLVKTAFRFPNTTNKASFFLGARSFLTGTPAQDSERQATSKEESVKKRLSGKTKASSEATEEKPPKIRKKDLSPPFKRPATGWTLFLRQHQVKKQAELGQAQAATFAAREAADIWNQFSPEEKGRYGPTEEDRENYALKRKEWFQSLSKAHKEAYKAQRKMKGTRMTAFSLFVKENFSKGDSRSIPENGKMAAQKYALLSETEKDALRQRANAIQEERQRKVREEDGK